MQLLAINGGGFLQGGLIMWAFALGTAPVLFAVGMWGNYIKEHKSGIISRTIGVLIIFFGVFSISNGRILVDTWGDREEQNMSTTTETIPQDISYERIDVWHNGSELVPQQVRLKAGGNYELIITPESNGIWCMNSMVIPKINREVHRIIKWEPITYKLTNIKAGKYDVVCSAMWMYQGTIIVE
jgi:hypothetical protein